MQDVGERWPHLIPRTQAKDGRVAFKDAGKKLLRLSQDTFHAKSRVSFKDTGHEGLRPTLDKTEPHPMQAN